MSGLTVDGLEVALGDFWLGPVSFSVASGGATVLLGPSGAGKTTLLRALAGFLPLRRGAVGLDGSELEGTPPERRRLGFVPPSLGLFPHRRVAENVGYPLERREEPNAERTTREWLARFDLDRLASRYPSQLSSGERQRVALCRALAARPRLLLWDEPLSALDVDRRDELLGLLRGVLAEERVPLLLVTHDPETAFSLADRYVVLDRGAERFAGSAEEFLSRPRDRFHARFLGFENVFGRDELEAARAHSALARLLAGRAGAGGLAAPAEAFVATFGPPGGFPFQVDRRQRAPHRSVLWGRSEGFAVRAIDPHDRAPSPSAVATLALREEELLPLEESAAAGEGR